MIIMLRLVLVFSMFTVLWNPLSAAASWEEVRLYDLAQGEKKSLPRILQELMKKRIILVGEHHTEERHHNAQLLIIKALHEAGVPLALGLEMFRADSQDALDQWLKGKLDDREFQKVYQDSWGYPLPLYGDIFEYARAKRIPLVGLNIPRTVTQKVARGGFMSLSKQEKEDLPFVWSAGWILSTWLSFKRLTERTPMASLISPTSVKPS